MAVYVVRAGESGPVKIGFAANVVGRMVKMQSDNHEPLKLLRLFEGGKTEEAALHARFAHRHCRAEWFIYDPDMMGDVGLRDAPMPAKPPMLWSRVATRTQSKLAAFLARPGNSAKSLAAACGVNTSTITRLAHGERNARYGLVEKVIKHTGGEVSFADILASLDEFRGRRRAPPAPAAAA